ncbi:benzoate 4-monooxygenase cytochrome P450 [Penicillium malachiteum]|uniref:Benzoate 4-monooxygenase cytochrome P450 n=1 Tax=Penicillium malachiteum TaxID=1324776 RepID=A0AAD6HJ27_9EURO|nr:benzoate 4-monooxygenase cytochrome P450 [Penicillium malachiteum]
MTSVGTVQSSIGSLSISQMIGSLLLVIRLKAVWTVVYNLFFHPLKNFPGPTLAAATYLYEYWFEIFRGGTYLFEVERLHEIYGPIIRFNPDEIHIKDSHYYDEICSSGTQRRDKSHAFISSIASPGATLATIEHDHHRMRHAMVSKFFSKQSFQALEPRILEHIELLMDKFEDSRKSETILNLHTEFAALTADIIAIYIFGMSFRDLAGAANVEDSRKAFRGLARYFHYFRFYPGLNYIVEAVPLWLKSKVFPEVRALLGEREAIRQECVKSLSTQSVEGQSFFNSLTGPSVSAAEKTIPRLADEGWIMLRHSSKDSAVGLFHLLSNETMWRTLRKEIRDAVPLADGPVNWSQVENLPYLSGVVNEALRLSFGVVSRSPRVPPYEPMVYKGFIIPPGTPISQSNYFVLRDPKIFHDPFEFRPERWFEPEVQENCLQHFFVVFSKGTRQCLGISLARCEIVVTLANIVRRFDLKLANPEENVEFRRDYIVAYPEKGDPKTLVQVLSASD